MGYGKTMREVGDMKKLKHTPGPWSWQEGDRYIRMRNEDSEKKGYWSESQKITETYYVNNSEETMSNNLLIAAAPEMLEALIMIYKVWHEDSILISSVKSVIEKATGLKIEEILNEN